VKNLTRNPPTEQPTLSSRSYAKMEKSVEKPAEFVAESPENAISGLIDGVHSHFQRKSDIAGFLAIEYKSSECFPDFGGKVRAYQFQRATDETLAVFGLVQLIEAWGSNNGVQVVGAGQPPRCSPGEEVAALVAADDEEPSAERFSVAALVLGQESDELNQYGLDEILGVGSVDVLELCPVQQERSVEAHEPIPGVRLSGLSQSVEECERCLGHWE
jgi:hypothetical protein